MKCSHFALIVVSGLMWLLIGAFLMTLGMHHIMNVVQNWEGVIRSNSFSILKFLAPFVSSEEKAMSVLVVLCLLVGYLKGRFVLMKTVKKGVQRIISYPNPAPLNQIYSKKYYFLIAGMMGLGFLLKRLHLVEDVRGAMDLAIGSALLKGALSYFHFAFQERKGSLMREV